MSKQNHNLELQKLKQKSEDLHKQLETEEIDLKTFREGMRELLQDIEELSNNANAFTTIDEPSKLKKTINTVFEAFLTSSYADNQALRTDALVLFNEIKQAL